MIYFGFFPAELLRESRKKCLLKKIKPTPTKISVCLSGPASHTHTGLNILQYRAISFHGEVDTRFKSWVHKDITVCQKSKLAK